MHRLCGAGALSLPELVPALLALLTAEGTAEARALGVPGGGGGGKRDAGRGVF